MEKTRGNTKKKIIEESMKLFSVQGFDSVSIRAIADAVGVGNSALYKHFKSKKEILDAIVSYSKEYFLSMGSDQMIKIQSLEDLKTASFAMFDFQTKDEWMVMFRRLLIMEQFRNPEMGEIYQKFFVMLPIEAQCDLFSQLMDMGLMKNGNAKVLAMELYAPFYLFHLSDGSGQDARALLEQHIENFWTNYITL